MPREHHILPRVLISPTVRDTSTQMPFRVTQDPENGDGSMLELDACGANVVLVCTNAQLCALVTVIAEALRGRTAR